MYFKGLLYEVKYLDWELKVNCICVKHSEQKVELRELVGGFELVGENATERVVIDTNDELLTTAVDGDRIEPDLFANEVDRL